MLKNFRMLEICISMGEYRRSKIRLLYKIWSKIDFYDIILKLTSKKMSLEIEDLKSSEI